MMRIKGEYTLDFIMTRMFNQYSVNVLSENNEIKDKGIEFFLKRIVGFTTDTIYEITLGRRENGESSIGDGLKSGTEQVAPAISLEKNKIILQSTILTDDIGGINEIGVKTEGESLDGSDAILISYDEFETLEDLGISANFILKYTYTFTYEKETIEWKITENNNIYKTNLTNTVTSIINNTQTEYQNVSTLEELKNTSYSFYQDNNQLYINTPVNPIEEKLIIN